MNFTWGPDDSVLQSELTGFDDMDQLTFTAFPQLAFTTETPTLGETLAAIDSLVPAGQTYAITEALMSSSGLGGTVQAQADFYSEFAEAVGNAQDDDRVSFICVWGPYDYDPVITDELVVALGGQDSVVGINADLMNWFWTLSPLPNDGVVNENDGWAKRSFVTLVDALGQL